MIEVGTLAQIRRLYHRNKQYIKEISRQTGLARNTVRSWLGEPGMVEPKYAPRVIVTKLDVYYNILYSWLKVDSGRGKREQRSKLHMWQELCDMGYTGSYARVCTNARLWKITEGLAGVKAAFIPIKFKHAMPSSSTGAPRTPSSVAYVNWLSCHILKCAPAAPYGSAPTHP